MKRIKKTVLFIVLLLLTGCATHLERKDKPMPEYLSEINNICVAKNIKVILKTNETEEGLFIKIDDKVLAIEQDGKIVEFLTEDITKIKYPRGFSTSGMVTGMVLGFVAGLIPIWVFNPDLGGPGGGGDKGAAGFLYIIPLTTAAGGVWGGSVFDKYNTISLVK